MEKLLFDLCSAHGVSGDEIDAHNVAKKDIENEYDKYDIMIETSGANPSFVLILKIRNYTLITAQPLF